MRIIVLHAPSGTGLSSAVQKIKDALSAPPDKGAPDGKAHSVHHVDLERVFLDEFSAFYEGGDLTERSPMQAALNDLPKQAASYLWSKAAAKAIRDLLLSRKEILLLSCHLTFYRGATHELYEPGDLNATLSRVLRELAHSKDHDLLEARPSLGAVITLIDDVFDMFVRLTEQTEVFDLSRLIREEYRRRLKERRELPKSSGGQYLLALEQSATVLSRLLVWRGMEITAGDSLAIRSAAKQYVLAVKHPVQTAINLILASLDLRSGLVPVYLSHPITRPRRNQVENSRKEWPGPWPVFVKEFKDFLAALTKVGAGRFLVFMPTSIDEYRFATIDQKQFPILNRRWPLLSSGGTELLYSLPEGFKNYEEYERAVILERLFNPIGGTCTDVAKEDLGYLVRSADELPSKLDGKTKSAVSGILGSLVQQIRIQLAMRDHALVRQTGRLLLYRPCYGDGDFSGGVRAEISNWCSILRTAEHFNASNISVSWPCGKSVYIHDSQDVDELKIEAAEEFQGQFRAGVSNMWGNEIARKLDFRGSEEDFEGWFARCEVAGDSLLGGTTARYWLPAHKAELEELWQERDEATREFYAGTGLDDPDWVEIVIEPRLGEKSFEEICDLLEQRVVEPLAEEVFSGNLEFSEGLKIAEGGQEIDGGGLNRQPGAEEGDEGRTAGAHAGEGEG